MKNNKIVFAVFIFIVFGFLAYFLYYKEKEMEVANSPSHIFKDGRQCYSYTHKAVEDEPYNVEEFIDLTINDGTVNGTKRGTQSGPDMTNAYTGTLVGTIDDEMINLIFSYTVEGSSNKEQEIYKLQGDQTGVEKWRYPLMEKDGILVPDTRQEFKILIYTRVEC